MYAHKPTSEV